MNIPAIPSKHAKRPGYPPRPTEPVDSEKETFEEEAPRPVPLATLLFLFGLLLTGVALKGSLATDLARHAAYGVGLSLALSFAIELRSGIRNLIRADNMALVALYFLTFFEFFFPQKDFAHMTSPESAHTAIIAVLWGMAALAVGRHLVNVRRHPFSNIFERPVPPSWMITLLWMCFGVGALHMLIAVNFNPIEMCIQIMGPRFSQPWQRGRFGDWKALITELGLFLYLIPPLLGIIFARRQKYTKGQLFPAAVLLAFIFFQGFASGTRNVFASYLATFVIGYAFAVPKSRQREVVTIGVAAAALLVFATTSILSFRQVGLLNYLQGKHVRSENPQQSLFIDYNLYAISKLMEAFPARHSFLGWEVPYIAVIRPIPRAIWPGKPEGLSFSIEDAMGLEGLTIAATFVGESYMAFGLPAVIATGLFFGMLTGWWGRLASPRNSDLGILIYASGFFAAVISMRSLFVFTTALLPTIAAIVLGSYIVKLLQERARRGAGPPSHPAARQRL